MGVRWERCEIGPLQCYLDVNAAAVVPDPCIQKAQCRSLISDGHVFVLFCLVFFFFRELHRRKRPALRRDLWFLFVPVVGLPLRKNGAKL